MIKIGDVLEGRYLIERKAGSGGSSCVYEGLHLRTDRKIAIKEINRKQFQESAGKGLQCLKNLRHQGLPMIFDVLETGESSLIVMEYIPGHTLQEELEYRKRTDRQFSVREVVQIGIDLAGILKYLHSLPDPLLYRDLKPENIIRTSDGSLVLVDLESICFSRWTRDPTVSSIGTTGFAAPEQYGEEGLQGGQADLYSLGAVLHCLLTGVSPGQIPFSFRKITELKPSLLEGDAVKRHQVQRLEAVIERCVSFRAAERFSTVAELQKALISIKDGSFISKKTDRFRVRVMLLVLAVLLFGGIFLESGRMIRKIRKEGAEYCLTKARHGQEEQLDQWVKAALQFSPGDAEAFSVLLDRMLADGAFSVEEEIRVRELLELTAEGETLEHEALLLQSPSEYVRFAFRMGTASLYEADGLPDYGAAGEWFRLVSEEGKGWIPKGEEEVKEKEDLTKKAELLETICDYKGDLLKDTLLAENPVRLSEYWTLLTEFMGEEVSFGSLFLTDLLLWREITGFLSDWAVELFYSGITWEEQEEIARLIKQHTDLLQKRHEIREMPVIKEQVRSLADAIDLVDRKRQILEEHEGKRNADTGLEETDKKEKKEQEYGR